MKRKVEKISPDEIKQIKEEEAYSFIYSMEYGIEDDKSAPGTCYSLTLTTPYLLSDKIINDEEISPTEAAAFYVCLTAGLYFVLKDDAFKNDYDELPFKVRKLQTKSRYIYKLQKDFHDVANDIRTEFRYQVGIFNRALICTLNTVKAKEICTEFVIKKKDRLLLEALCIWDINIDKKYNEQMKQIGSLHNYQKEALDILKHKKKNKN